MAAASTVTRAIFCESQTQKSINSKKELVVRKLISVDSSSWNDSGRIVLQPRVCTLRSFSSDRPGLVKTRGDVDDVAGIRVSSSSSFFASLSEYIENSRKTQDYEIISGRFAMIQPSAAPHSKTKAEARASNSAFNSVARS
ncbi:hypothetical protein AQUCO_12600002v1 [Aquilegia coerulea]|uniref:Uncharacterized protein n=1 Tax=Aquilegia coerulea TaxID=218851 RepID=A0A2G5C2N8_AQUCA|nr:hypothetical protein AQUCO_12600002v1 [Aquilegia coerulea]